MGRQRVIEPRPPPCMAMNVIRRDGLVPRMHCINCIAVMV